MAGALVAYCTSDDDDRSWYQPKYHYYDAVASLTVEGEPVEVRGTIECTRHFDTTSSGKLWIPVLFIPPTNTHDYESSANAIGKRLTSGAGILVIPQNLCEYGWPKDDRIHKDRFAKVNQSGFLPYVFWLDDADNPTRIEAYVSEAYYAGPSPRVVFHSLKYENAEARPWLWPRFPPKLADEIGWLGGKLTENLFRGYFAVPVDQGRWSRIEGLEEEVNTFSGLVVAPCERLTAEFCEELRSLSDGLRSRFARSGVLRPDGRFAKRRPEIFKRRYAANRKIIPLLPRDGGVFTEIQPFDHRGYVVAIPYQHVKGPDIVKFMIGEYRFSTIVGAYKKGLIFDSAEQRFYRIEYLSIGKNDFLGVY
jgi:hypothetical protein